MVYVALEVITRDVPIKVPTINEKSKIYGTSEISDT